MISNNPQILLELHSVSYCISDSNISLAGGCLIVINREIVQSWISDVSSYRQKGGTTQVQTYFFFAANSNCIKATTVDAISKG